METKSLTAADMRFNPPEFDVSQLSKQVMDDYGFEGDWYSLDGERDQNFRLKTQRGESFVVKVAGPDEDPEIASYQVEALLYLEKTCPDLPVPRIVLTKSGQTLSSVEDAKGVRHVLRLVSYLPGIPYGEGIFPNAEELQQVGAMQAKGVNALKGFEHPASHMFMPWNLSNGVAVSDDLWKNADQEIQNLAAPLMDRLRDVVLPELNSCPSQIIHNDAHAWNLLRPDEETAQVVGIIDFGDMVYAPVINELAVSGASFFSAEKGNIDAIENLLIGFHQVHALSEKEVSLLWDAITLRVFLMIVLSDVKLLGEGPVNPDVVEERADGIAKLKFIRSQSHDEIVGRFKKACGYY